jgi:hydroxymethylbilane synthase
MNKTRSITIGSRGSELALWQANYIQLELRRIGLESTIEIIKTRGDQIQDLSFDKLEGKGFFTKEIEDALLSGSIDLAVHSHKDLETTEPSGLTVAAVSYREDPADILLIHKDSVDLRNYFSLKKNATVGTSSPRRKSQLLSLRNDLKMEDLRGNVPTRVQKLRDKKYDAILIAKAGVQRLQIDLSDFHVEFPDPRILVPAPAQGVLALQIRSDDTDLKQALQKLNYADVEICIKAERKLLNQLQGGCQMPVGAYCTEREENKYQFFCAVSSEWKEHPRRIFLEGENPEELCRQAIQLLAKKDRPSVYISRNYKSDDYFFRSLEKNGYKVKGASLTRYAKVEFTGIPETDWIFFSSKNCVTFFYDQNPTIPENVKIGSIGGATAEALKKRGIICDFTGSSNDTVQIGKDFALITEGQRILFPQSTASYRTVQKQFQDQKYLTDLVVYDTIPNEEVKIPDAEILVFTSPTNALLYLRKKEIAGNQKVIAIGKSTAEVLRNEGVNNVIIPWNTSEIAMSDAVMSL